MYEAPTVADGVWLETFDGEWESRWTYSEAAEYDGRFEVRGPFDGMAVGQRGDVSLVVPESHHKYGLSRELDFAPRDGRTFVAQFEVRLQKPLECGGAYLKFISAPADGSAFDATTLDNETPYSVMFGPDKCGSESKVHFIFNRSFVLLQFVKRFPPYLGTSQIRFLFLLFISDTRLFV